jgi:alkaline phosphatase D
MTTPFDRRSLIKAASLLAVMGGTGVFSPVWAAAALGGDPFTLGVASGDPSADGFVIWTRLALKPLEHGGGMPMRTIPVRWEVAEDDRFARVVAQGEAPAAPELGHSVHIEVAGLKPASRYWYRFSVGGEQSRTGTVRTAPVVGTRHDRLRIGVAGCQHYEAGLYTAYGYLSREPDLDAIFHYGDYIYEGAAGRGCPPAGGGARACFRSHVGDEIYTLDDYRRRYAQYKTDPDLQAAHAAAAFLSSYDDHEVDNNWAGIEDQDATPPALFKLRRFAAMQAWYENMPVRLSQFPGDTGLRMNRRIDFGDLVRIHLLDTRQYRTGQVCAPKGNPTAGCRPINDPSRPSILGEAQSSWLADGLSGDMRWNLLAQQVMVMPMLYPETRAAGRVNNDSWSGYPASREQLVAAIEGRRLTNVVIATGDVHKHHAGVLPRRSEVLDSAPVATEFVCSSISSDGDGVQLADDWKGMPGDNPHCRLFDGRRGYQVFDIGRDQWRTDVRVVDRVTTAGGALLPPTRFVVDRRRAGLSVA